MRWRTAHPRPRLTSMLACTLVVAALACRDLGPREVDCLTEDTLGSFSGQASGAASDALAGCAYFTTDTPSRRFGMVLTHGGPRSTSHVIRLFLPMRPDTPGTFTLTSGLSGVVFLGDRRFTLTSGTLNVTSASPVRRTIDGNLNLAGTDAAGSVTIAGSFLARCVASAGEIGIDRPREEWSALCDHPSCFPFPCALAIGDANIASARRVGTRFLRNRAVALVR